MSNAYIHVEHLTKSFGSLMVLNDISFDVAKGEFLCVVGPTGCGKTTFLSCLIGAQPIDSGIITLEGQPVDLRTRNIAYIMQEYSTMPWLTVAQNVAFGLNIKHASKERIEQRLREVMEITGLSKFAAYYPNRLSASMLQRVAIARAFAVEPELLLMDEPYGQLDIDLRYKLEDELLHLCRRYGTTVIFITHNIEEAIYLGQRALILTNKPTSIKDAVNIPLSYPRDVAQDAFIRLRTRVTDAIKWW